VNVDIVKAIFTYLTAFAVVVGGFVLIYFTRLDASAQSMQLLIGGFIGSALTFLFVQENSTRTARSTERQVQLGVNTQAGPPSIPPPTEPTK
jgi:positive regulator of sigma E activity